MCFATLSCPNLALSVGQKHVERQWQSNACNHVLQPRATALDSSDTHASHARAPNLVLNFELLKINEMQPFCQLLLLPQGVLDALQLVAAAHST